MKRISLFGQAALLLLVCFALVVAASLAYRKKLQAKRLDRVLSFQSSRIDKCTVGPAMLCDKMTVLGGADANSVARRFAALLKEHCRHIKKGESADFAPTHRITLTAERLTWEFRLRLDQDPPCRYIQCRTPELASTIILGRQAAPQFEKLIKSVMDEQSRQPQRKIKEED